MKLLIVGNGLDLNFLNGEYSDVSINRQVFEDTEFIKYAIKSFDVCEKHLSNKEFKILKSSVKSFFLSNRVDTFLRFRDVGKVFGIEEIWENMFSYLIHNLLSQCVDREAEYEKKYYHYSNLLKKEITKIFKLVIQKEYHKIRDTISQKEYLTRMLFEKIKEYDWVITYNYTNTIEDIFKVYKTDPPRIVHIHGQFDNERLIMGRKPFYLLKNQLMEIKKEFNEDVIVDIFGLNFENDENTFNDLTDFENYNKNVLINYHLYENLEAIWTKLDKLPKDLVFLNEIEILKKLDEKNKNLISLFTLNQYHNLQSIKNNLIRQASRRMFYDRKNLALLWKTESRGWGFIYGQYISLDFLNDIEEIKNNLNLKINFEERLRKKIMFRFKNSSYFLDDKFEPRIKLFNIPVFAELD